MHIKTTSARILTFISLLILIGLASFAGYWGVKFNGIFLCEMFALSVILAFISNIKKSKYLITYPVPAELYVWVLFTVYVLISFRANMLGSTRILSGVLLCLCLKNNVNWIRQSLNIITLMTGLSVLFTYVFLIFPGLYSAVIKAYGFIPTGTSQGAAGYRAGLSDHCSQNGIYVSIFFLIFVSVVFEHGLLKKGDKYKRIKILFALVAAGAILLTGKRGVLVFSLISAMTVYLIASKKKIDRMIRIIIMLLISAGVLQILSEVVPQMGYVFERFQVIGEDGSTAERLAMWDVALRKFFEKPLFGNGFWSFRRFYNQELGRIFHPYQEKFQILNAHNVYLQVLCETGMCGFIVYILAISVTLKKTIFLVKNIVFFERYEERVGVLFSMGFQVFYITYSFSGNCLYDIVFPFYCIAIAMMFSIWSKYNNIKRR